MEEGMPIESRLVSRQIQKAQKKVEERNFDTRKHLLEYDEVMDTQRKRVYRYRQDILEDADCKILILEMIAQQVDAAVARFRDDGYGPGTFGEFASARLGVEFEAGDFNHTGYDEAVVFAFNKANRNIATQVQDMMEENLGDEDPKQWNWQALAGQVNARWGLKTTDRQLKQFGKEQLSEYLIAEAEKALSAIDLEEGRHYLEPGWGLESLANWMRRKFQIELNPKDLAPLDEDALRALLMEKVEELYDRKEVEFPVQAGMATFMAEKTVTRGQKYDREGLFNWARVRFPAAVDELHEEEFRTQSRARLQERLQAVSKKCYPSVKQTEIDAQLDQTFAHTDRSESEDARELAAWAKSRLDLEVSEESLTGVSKKKARDVLWNTFDVRYRPEMRTLERSLLLHHLDTAWKNHLYAMDHLREGMRMMWVGQIDPKTEYKRQGMKEFESMWEGINDKVSDMVFRMEEAEGFQDSIWAIGETIHAAAPRVMAEAEQTSTNSGEAKKREPIRKRGEKVGRNDPCPCGSGKKYKHCHMRQVAG
jgi:preprotein translocase subunit SecA